jgi:capsular exopolysaccharide synthesis family protein
MVNEKDKLSEALRKAQEEREKNAKKAAPPLDSEYIAPIVPKKPEAAKEGIDARLVAYTDPKSPVAEQYRNLTTHLLSLPDAATLKIFAITSSSLQEGKTITALNLAIVLAQDLEKKVLVVDCNLRRPACDLYLGITTQKGLGDILAKTALVDEVVIETGIHNLFCICAGQTEVSPTELLSSQKMEDTLTSLRNRFDYIILDTPAVIPYADPRIISKVSDGVLLVVKAEKTRREVINRTESLLKEVGAKVLGVTLTNIQYHIPEYIHKHL